MAKDTEEADTGESNIFESDGFVVTTDIANKALRLKIQFPISYRITINKEIDISILPSGQVQITMNTQLGRTYFVEVSSNLKDWTVLTNFVGSVATSQVLDIRSSSQRFYRALTP